MILELIEHCLTPCSWMARSMGFLTSTIQVKSRYRRCKQSWQPHLDCTRAAILDAARLAGGRRTALLFGAGLLHDIPLRELSAAFEEVVLADIVHSLSCRLTALRFPNVRLQALDITGVMDQLPAIAKRPSTPLPACKPTEFLEEPRLDFAVSVNLLSQLGWVPGLFLEGKIPNGELAAFQRSLVLAHLEYLRRLPGHSALITDVSWSARPREGGAGTREWGVLQGVLLPEPDCSWEWAIAPAPERERGTDYAAKVQGYLNWKRAAAGWAGGICAEGAG